MEKNTNNFELIPNNGKLVPHTTITNIKEDDYYVL